MTVVELGQIARKRNPDIGLIVTRAGRCRGNYPTARSLGQAWAPLDVIREAERMAYAWSLDEHGRRRLPF